LGRIKRGGYIFVTWIGDHLPRHVHVYDDDVELLIWDLDKSKVIEGDGSRRILEIIKELVEEGLL
jgi:hypothetical protein